MFCQLRIRGAANSQVFVFLTQWSCGVQKRLIPISSFENAAGYYFLLPCICRHFLADWFFVAFILCSISFRINSITRAARKIRKFALCAAKKCKSTSICMHLEQYVCKFGLKLCRVPTGTFPHTFGVRALSSFRRPRFLMFRFFTGCRRGAPPGLQRSLIRSDLVADKNVQNYVEFNKKVLEINIYDHFEIML